MEPAFLRWALLRSAFARGYWLATALYLVVVAELSPFQLVLIGVFQGLTVLVAEIPAGVLADTVSRRLSLVVGHVVMGAGMAMAGMVTAFPLLVVSQCLWGLGWAFSSGADVAWVTDELGRRDLVDRVLTAQARWELLGLPLGMVLFGALGWATSLSTSIVVAGMAMVLLGLAVARWPETGFVPAAAGRRWREATAIFTCGVGLARTDPVVRAVVGATLLVNGGAAVYGRLLERRLVLVGMPTDPNPIVWFAALGMAGAGAGAVALRVVERRLDDSGAAARSGYVLSCATGAAGLVVFAVAGDVLTAAAASLVVSGVAGPIIRATATLQVNRRTSSAARATVHSLLSQAENTGEIVIALLLAAVASASPPAALLAAAMVFLLAAATVGRVGERSAPRRMAPEKSLPRRSIATSLRPRKSPPR